MRSLQGGHFGHCSDIRTAPDSQTFSLLVRIPPFQPPVPPAFGRRFHRRSATCPRRFGGDGAKRRRRSLLPGRCSRLQRWPTGSSSAWSKRLPDHPQRPADAQTPLPDNRRLPVDYRRDLIGDPILRVTRICAAAAEDGLRSRIIRSSRFCGLGAERNLAAGIAGSQTKIVGPKHDRPAYWLFSQFKSRACSPL